jgi:hypothetical protein
MKTLVLTAWLALVVVAFAGGICSPEDKSSDDEASDNDVADDDLVDDDSFDDDAADDDIDDDIDDDLDDDLDDDVDDDATDDDIVDDDTADDDVDDDVVDDDVTDDDAVDDDTTDDDAVDDDATDDDTVVNVTCYIDRDYDGYGSNNVSREFANECPYGWSDVADDCNDEDFLTHPNAAELPNDNIDQNCDSVDFLASDDLGIFVSPAGDDVNPGTSALPKKTIGAAITAAQEQNKVVFVAGGTYEESVSAAVSMFGGYDPGDWATRSPVYDQPSTIDATGAYGLEVPSGANVVVERFVLNGGESSVYSAGASILGEALFAACSTTGGLSAQSAGFLNSGTATIVNCEASGGEVAGTWEVSIGIDNVATMTLVDSHSYGLSIGYTFDRTVVRGCDIEVSRSGYICTGRSVVIWGIGPVLIHDSRWAGVSHYFGYSAGDVRLVNNVIERGVEGEEMAVTLINNVLDQLVVWDGSATLINNIIYSPSEEDCPIFIADGAATLVNNDFWNETGAPDALLCDAGSIVTELAELNGCAWPGCVQSAGNISASPAFVDPVGGDYHLLAESSCVDTGADASSFVDDPVLFDFDGDSRPFGNGWDIGADEFTGAGRR